VGPCAVRVRTVLARGESDRENESVPVIDPPLVSIADLADGGGGVASLDDIGQVRDPLVLVGLDGTAPPAAVARAADRVRADGRLYVGVAAEPLPETLRPLLTALDTTLVAAATADAIQGGAGHDSTGHDSTDHQTTDAEHQTTAPGQQTTSRRPGHRVCVPVADVQGEAASLAAVVASVPQAAVVLGQVLRATETLPVGAALDVESFAYSMLLGGPEFRTWYDERGERPLPGLVAEPVLVRRDGSRLMITLNRPERRNAYGRQLRDALADALRIALLDAGVERVVLDGAGASFCAGGDLAEFGTTPDLTTAHFVRTQGGAGLLLSALKDRVEVHVHGPCVGAGVELPAFAGTVIAAAGTTFRLPEVGMGLIPGAGGTVSIPRRIGRWRTLYLALSGRPLDAATALSWGLVDLVRPA
jgi:Enoyl-CoA hydratase/isomerase